MTKARRDRRRRLRSRFSLWPLCAVLVIASFVAVTQEWNRLALALVGLFGIVCYSRIAWDVVGWVKTGIADPKQEAIHRAEAPNLFWAVVCSSGAIAAMFILAGVVMVMRSFGGCFDRSPPSSSSAPSGGEQAE